MKQKIISPMVSMVLGLSALTMVTSGCSSVDEALGKTKSAPDEFEVVVRPPLTLPPNFNLNPENDTAEAPVSSTDAVSVSTRVLTKTPAQTPAFLMPYWGQKIALLVSVNWSMKKPMAFNWNAVCRLK